MPRGSRSISRPAADQRQHLGVVTLRLTISGTARRAEHFCCEASVLRAVANEALARGSTRAWLGSPAMSELSLCTMPARGAEVEFMDADGRTLVVATLQAHQVGPVRGRQVLHVRPLPGA